MVSFGNLLAPVVAILSVLGPAGAARAQSCQGWTQRTPPTSPSRRAEHAMAYDSARGVTVLFGGSAGGKETWEWDGNKWMQKATTGPTARIYHAMVYDSARHVCVLYPAESHEQGQPGWEHYNRDERGLPDAQGTPATSTWPWYDDEGDWCERNSFRRHLRGGRHTLMASDRCTLALERRGCSCRGPTPPAWSMCRYQQRFPLPSRSSCRQSGSSSRTRPGTRRTQSV